MRRLVFVLAMVVTLVGGVVAEGFPEQADEFIEFVDRLIEEEMERNGVPNATLSVVRGDQVYALRGYGLADQQAERPVDPEQTIFRAASVSKSVVATAVMTLADRGVISLDDDVNRWLSEFTVPKVNGTEVTWHDLLTHSSGMDDKVYFPTTAEDAAGYISLDEAFRSSPPVRFAESGQVTRYSNQGYALLGYLIEQASGIRFEEYVERYVFAPLAMRSSTFEQILPDGLVERVTKAYAADEEAGWIEQPTIYVNEMPAGGLYTTSGDMARFMAMHINGGSFEGRQVLSEALVAQMHESQFSPHPALGGFGYGFWQSTHNGERLVMHDGNGPSIATRLLMIPEQRMGFFLAQQGGSSVFLLAVTDRILDEYFGETPDPTPIASGSVEQYAGTYKDNRYVHNGYFRVPTRVGLEITIRAEDGRLVAADPLEGVERDYVQVSPGVFARADRPETKLAFVTDERGRVTRMHALLYDLPIDFEPAGWWERNAFLLVLYLAPALVFLLVMVVLPIAALVRKLRKRTRPLEQRRVLWFSWGFSLLGFVIMALFLLGDFSPLLYWSPTTNPVAVYGFLTFAFVTSVLALGVPATWFLALRRKYWGWVGIIAHSVLLVGTLLFIWFSVYNGLFSFAA